MDVDHIEELLRQNIEAVNRTTSAVRGIATFLLIEVATALIATFLLTIGFFFQQEWLIGLGGLVLLAGVIYGVVVLKGEINDSITPLPSLRRVNSIDRPFKKFTDVRDIEVENFNRMELDTYNSLSEKQKDMWRSYGQPSFKNWNNEKVSFEDWLKANPFG